MEFKALLQEDPKALHTCESTKKKVKDKKFAIAIYVYKQHISGKYLILKTELVTVKRVNSISTKVPP